MVSGEPVRTHRKGKAPEVTALVALPRWGSCRFGHSQGYGGLRYGNLDGQGLV